MSSDDPNSDKIRRERREAALVYNRIRELSARPISGRFEREFPGLDESRAMSTSDRREYEAFFTVERLRAAVREQTLEAIIKGRLRANRSVGGEADADLGFPVLNAAA